MNSIAISFRIADKTINGRTYDERYEALIEAVRGIIEGKHWDQSTAFILVQTNMTTERVCDTCCKALEPSHDLVLVMSVTHKAAYIGGKNDDNDIYSIIEFLKKC